MFLIIISILPRIVAERNNNSSLFNAQTCVMFCDKARLNADNDKEHNKKSRASIKKKK
jgi:hypothetical protein